MPLNVGIVGLPNVGKSTIFSALTSVPAEAANYPFCTIDPNVGIVPVPDERLQRLSEIIRTEKVIPTVVEFVDIAGLVRGASKGEGRGNQFLAHIRETGIIAHVVRCFDDDDVTHVDGSIDPIRDIDTIDIELALADLETVTRRRERLEKELKSHDKKIAAMAKALQPVLEALTEHLQDGRPTRSLELSPEQRAMIYDLHLLTAKPVLYVCNVDESGMDGSSPYEALVRGHAAGEGAEVVRICGQLEAEIAALETKEERRAFLDDAGLQEPGLAQLIRSGYRGLGMRTFFTAGPKENRAWTFHEGATAPEAAGVIHTDFQKGFIRAETYHIEDLFTYGSEQKVREAGKLRQEGKEYRVKDGDVMFFKFNV
ncbi:MAG: redox-regulated ATPase YchF [Alkalispirochaeta sp.]